MRDSSGSPAPEPRCPWCRTPLRLDMPVRFTCGTHVDAGPTTRSEGCIHRVAGQLDGEKAATDRILERLRAHPLAGMSRSLQRLIADLETEAHRVE